MTPTSPRTGFGGLHVRPPVAFPGQRIGLLGGSFNPPHQGHLRISLHALKKLRLDRVWWIVTPGNPLKENNNLASLEERMAAARRLARHPRIEITGFEEALPSRYTAATIAFLTRRFAGTRFVWLMGADNLVSIHRWNAWTEIYARVPIAVLDRPGWRLRGLSSKAAGRYRQGFVGEDRANALPRRRPPAWTFITLPLSPQSSTEIRRRRAAKGRDGAEAGGAAKPG